MRWWDLKRTGSRSHPAPGRSGGEGFSLLEVLVATGLMGLMLVVLLQVLSSIFRTEASVWKNSQALLVAERVLDEACRRSSLTAGVLQGREEDFAYQIITTPQYEISGPMGEQQLRCALIQVTVYWRERGRPKSLSLETARTGVP